MGLSIKKMLPRTLFGRSLLIIATPILLIQVCMAYVFFDRHWTKMMDRLSFAVAGEIAIISDYLEDDYTPQRFDIISRHVAQSLELLISFDKGADLPKPKAVHDNSSYSSYLVKSTLSEMLEKQVRRPFFVRVSMEEKWVEVAVQLKEGVLYVSMPQRRLFSSSSYIFLLWMLAISLVLLLVAVLFMRNQIRPIRRLAVAAERFGKGQEIPSSFKPEGAREVRQAAKAFLEMHERIRRQIQQRTAMLAGVSHDLRTPLTRMKLQLAMLGEGPDVEELKTDIDDMERMIYAYLDFVRGEGEEEPVRTDLTGLLNRIVSNYKRQNKEIDADILAVSMQLKPLAFERCIGNLVGNACTYGDKVWLTMEEEPHEIRIIIDDNGPGLDPSEYEDVFRPFYRKEGSRNQATGGVGLGLPIAQDIVHGHGGEIELAPSPHGGLRVIVKLPV